MKAGVGECWNRARRDGAGGLLLLRHALFPLHARSLARSPGFFRPPQEAKAYGKLRIERANARLVGIREKRAKEEAAKEKTDK